MADAGKYIEYKYTLAPDKYMVDFNVTLNLWKALLHQIRTVYPRLENVYSAAGKRKAE